VALPDLTQLDQHAATPFQTGYPANVRIFYAPIDNLHGVLLDLIRSAKTSLVLAMYGFDDPELAEALREKLEDEQVFVQLTLDRSQAGGVHEKQLLAQEQYPASSIAVGSSERSRIMHMKALIVDGIDTVGGSTNWSVAGETLQDNELRVLRDPLEAARARARIDVIHHHMLQAAAKHAPVGAA
jgi:phosphatidylserine/phosphatidylglycerophosphate/cardiolipin synthase-like enzyme